MPRFHSRRASVAVAIAVLLGAAGLTQATADASTASTTGTANGTPAPAATPLAGYPDPAPVTGGGTQVLAGHGGINRIGYDRTGWPFVH